MHDNLEHVVKVHDIDRLDDELLRELEAGGGSYWTELPD
jgi:hypothetical protein